MGKKDFKYKTKETKTKTKDTTNNVTTCLDCKFTCHANCVYSNGADKEKCCAMDESGDCKACPGKCNWKLHHNKHYIIEHYTEEVERTN